MTAEQVGQLPQSHPRTAVSIKGRAEKRIEEYQSRNTDVPVLKADGWHLCFDGAPFLGLVVYPRSLFVTGKVIQALDPQRFSNVEERCFSKELTFSLAQFDSRLSHDLREHSLSREVYQYPDPNIRGEVHVYFFPREHEETLLARINDYYTLKSSEKKQR